MILLFTIIWVLCGSLSVGAELALNTSGKESNLLGSIFLLMLGSISLFIYIGYIFTKRTMQYVS
jgi:hypothetical protein